MSTHLLDAARGQVADDDEGVRGDLFGHARLGRGHLKKQRLAGEDGGQCTVLSEDEGLVDGGLVGENEQSLDRNLDEW
jgi:hypothetical protein